MIPMSMGKIHELYKEGRRDFSGISCVSGRTEVTFSALAREEEVNRYAMELLEKSKTGDDR